MKDLIELKPIRDTAKNRLIQELVFDMMYQFEEQDIPKEILNHYKKIFKPLWFEKRKGLPLQLPFVTNSEDWTLQHEINIYDKLAKRIIKDKEINGYQDAKAVF